MIFNVQARDKGSRARAGVLSLPHGDVLTPIFMPVGTLGTVKTVLQKDLESEVKAQIILGNTYHLYLRPGMEVMEAAGGLHPFMSWEKPILTDSGGYQVYSLSQRRKIVEEGVTFYSHIDGSRHVFTPENVMETQRIIGADIIMAFDECPPYPATEEYARKSMEMTHRWLLRCRAYMKDKSRGPYGHHQVLAPIMQGSVYPALRRKSAEFTADHGEGICAIGGLSVGEPKEDLYGMTGLVTDILPKEQARYLMGVGTPEDLVECIDRGVDMFDCVLPTRNARHGVLYTWEGVLHIKNARWKSCFEPIDPESSSETSRRFTKAYLRHLFQAKEYLAAQIASIHNLAFYLDLVGRAREHILNGSFSTWKTEVLPRISRKL